MRTFSDWLQCQFQTQCRGMQLAAGGPQKQRASSYVRNDANTAAAKLSQIRHEYRSHFSSRCYAVAPAPHAGRLLSTDHNVQCDNHHGPKRNAILLPCLDHLINNFSLSVRQRQLPQRWVTISHDGNQTTKFTDTCIARGFRVDDTLRGMRVEQQRWGNNLTSVVKVNWGG